MSEPTQMDDDAALRSALQALCDHRDATLVQARIEMRDVPTVVVTACGAARSIDGAREVELAKSLGPVMAEAMRSFVQSVKDEERDAAVAALTRILQVVNEERVSTPTSARLAAACDDARAFLAQVRR